MYYSSFHAAKLLYVGPNGAAEVKTMKMQSLFVVTNPLGRLQRASPCGLHLYFRSTHPICNICVVKRKEVKLKAWFMKQPTI